MIPAPYMYDAYGEMSFDVSYTITGSNGTYYLSVTADDSWINAEDRVFPITIDPSISTHTDYAIMDTYITGDLPNEARGMHKFMFVGRNEVAYIKVPTPSFSFDIEINEAHLALNYFYKDFVKSGYVDITAHRVTELLWVEEFLTWQAVVNTGFANFGLEHESQGDAVRALGTVGATSASPKALNVEITKAFKAWVEDSVENRGIGLKYVTGSPNRSVMLRSKEILNQYRPQLIYSYTHTHTYDSSSILFHPHTISYECECGETIERYPLKVHCDECREGMRTATETVGSINVFFYIDEGILIPAAIDCYVKYTNYYTLPASEPYGYPPFATFESLVESYCANSAYPAIICTSALEVHYYSASGEKIWTQEMKWNLDADSIPLEATVYTLDTIPSYTTTGAIFWMPETTSEYYANVTTYFN